MIDRYRMPILATLFLLQPLGPGSIGGNVAAGELGVAPELFEPDSFIISSSLYPQAYVKASGPAVADLFGSSVALSGDTLLVGAPRDDISTVNGAAYVYVRTGTGWLFEDSLKVNTTDAGDRFGAAVAIDGDTLVVGAPNASAGAGRAYVFVRGPYGWSEQAVLSASNAGAGDSFGFSVAIAGDHIAVGAYREDGADNGTTDSGAVYIFSRQGAQWPETAYLKAADVDVGDRFGFSISLSGLLLAVGVPLEDGGASGVGGDPSDDSATNTGAVYVFDGADEWRQQAYLKASNPDPFDQFGEAVAISGETVVVGTWHEFSRATGVDGDQEDDTLREAGAAYVFVRDGGAWRQEAYLKASNTGFMDHFAVSVGIDGDTVVVGARLEDSAATGVGGPQSDGSTDSGAAYVFRRQNGSWSQIAYLKAINTDPADELGGAVAISGDHLVAGARYEDSASRLIDGDPEDDSREDAGAVYIFAGLFNR